MPASLSQPDSLPGSSPGLAVGVALSIGCSALIGAHAGGTPCVCFLSAAAGILGSS